MMFKSIFIVLIILFFQLSVAHSDLYKYTDGNGIVHFTNSPPTTAHQTVSKPSNNQAVTNTNRETIYVKYRGPVNLAPFECEWVSSSSLIKRLCYDAKEQYVIVNLNGVYYHYCEVPAEVVDTWKSAESMGKFYKAFVKGNYDCRINRLPAYDKQVNKPTPHNPLNQNVSKEKGSINIDQSAQASKDCAYLKDPLLESSCVSIRIRTLNNINALKSDPLFIRAYQGCVKARGSLFEDSCVSNRIGELKINSPTQTKKPISKSYSTSNKVKSQVDNPPSPTYRYIPVYKKIRTGDEVEYYDSESGDYKTGDVESINDDVLEISNQETGESVEVDIDDVE